MEYQLELKQIVDYPRCRIYRPFIRRLDRGRLIKFHINNWKANNISLEYNYPCQKDAGFFFFPVAAVHELVSMGKCSEMDIVLDMWIHAIYNDSQVQGSDVGPVVYFRTQVCAGWLSLLVNAGEGIDVDIFFDRQPKDRIQQKLGQQLRINRSKIKDTSDTNSDYDDLDSAIRSGYFLKEELAAKIQRLHIFFSLLIPYMSHEERQLLDEALIQTYKLQPPCGCICA